MAINGLLNVAVHPSSLRDGGTGGMQTIGSRARAARSCTCRSLELSVNLCGYLLGILACRGRGEVE